MTYKEHNEKILATVQNTDEVVLARKDDTEMTLRVNIQNSEGYQQDVSTLAKVKAEIVDQKVYGEELSNFATITSEAGYADSLVYYTEEAIADVDGKGSSDGMAGQGANVEYVRKQYSVIVDEWKAGYDATHTELNQAQMTGNRSAIVSKERSLATKLKAHMNNRFFLGEGNLKGLLNMANVSTDTTTVDKNISAMTQAELESIFPTMYTAFRAGNSYTEHADTLVMSSQEMEKLVKVYSEFGIALNIELIEKSFRALSGNANFKVVSTLYAAAANAPAGKETYVLYNSSNVFFDVPVEVETLWNKGMDIRNDKLVRHSEVYCERPQEALYFTVA